MNKKYLYLAAAGLAGAILAYFCTKAHAEAADAAAPVISGGGTVIGGDPIIVSGTFGYALPAAVPARRF